MCSASDNLTDIIGCGKGFQLKLATISRQTKWTVAHNKPILDHHQLANSAILQPRIVGLARNVTPLRPYL